MQYVTNSGSGSGLIFAGKYGVIPFVNQFPTDSNIYRKISTKFNEKSDILTKTETPQLAKVKSDE
jgi:hypothetical protein